MNINFIALFVILDVLSFTRRDNPGIFWKLLFSYWIGTNGRKMYYIYRPLQGVLFGLGLWLCLPEFQPFVFEWSYFTGLMYSLVPAIAYLLSFSLYVTDLWYYVLNLEFESLLGFERRKEETFWLEHPYQIGHYTWKEFSLKQFMWFSVLGTVLLIISNLI